MPGSLEYVYAYALVYNPSAYLGVFLPIVYGGTIGAVTAWTGKRFKIRNPTILTVFATVLDQTGCVCPPGNLIADF